MNRREFLQCAAVLVSGVSANGLAFTLNDEQQQYLATAPDYNTGKVDYLTAAQRRTLAAVCENIIPRTDTPGAIDAGVPQFIELMVRDWLTDEERSIFDVGMKDLQERVQREHASSFDQLEPRQQLAILETLEEQAEDSPWYSFGNVQRDFISDAPFICQVKELTAWGFFTSRVGATQVLRYDPMPMYFDGDVPLSPEDSSSVGHFR